MNGLDLLACAALGGFILWVARRRPSRAEPPRRLPPSPVQRTETVELAVPQLGKLEGEIAAALRGGKDPNAVLTIPHRAHHLAVVGESFANNNGTSRQQIIERAQPGTSAYLVPEPDNPHDAEAVRVYISEGGATTAQIGYLPGRDKDGILDEIRRGHVAAWLASRERSQGGMWGAVIFVVRTEAG